MNRRFDLSEFVPELQLEINDDRVRHFPHHAVYHAKKPTKIKVFFECSAVLVSVSVYSYLLRMIWVQGDIELKFYQVIVLKKDSDCLRCFCWKDGNLDVEPKQFRTKVVLGNNITYLLFCSQSLLTLSNKSTRMNLSVVFN